jgi:exonuclease SbcD
MTAINTGVKIFHASDIHYCPEHLEEVDRCFGYAVDRAIAAGAQVAVLGGDLFDHWVSLHHPCVAAAMARVHRLAQHMPAIVLQGTLSHDTPGCLDAFKTLGGDYPVHVADRIEQVALCETDGHVHWVASDSTRFDAMPTDTQALFSCLPAVNKGVVAATYGAKDAPGAAGAMVADLLLQWAPSHTAARAAGIPVTLISHGTVAESISEQGVPMAGMDHEYTTGALFAAQASAVMLGHIHQHQQWEQDGRRIAYPGSPGRLHFGEVTAKGALIWNVQPNEASAEFVETPAKRLIQIDYPGAPDIDELAELAKGAAEAHVRVRYTIDEDYSATVDKKGIERLFLAQGASVCKVQAAINPVQRTRAEGMNKSADLTDKLDTWGRVTETPTDTLRPRLRLLQTYEPARIVADILED